MNAAMLGVFHSTIPADGLPAAFWLAGLAAAAFLALAAWAWWRAREAGRYRIGPAAGGDQPFASLVLEQSDTFAPGRRFDLRKPLSRLGRSAGNDIVLPDKPVSRLHAELHAAGGRLTLVEVRGVSGGEVQSPRYGTFVNGVQVPARGRALKYGDRIRLGSRTTLRLERAANGATDDRTRAVPLESGADPDATREVRESPDAPDATRGLPEVPDLDATRTFNDDDDAADEPDATRAFNDDDED